MFGDIARLLAGQGPVNWDSARQIALSIATEGKPEFNIDPNKRIELDALARIADLHVTDVTGLDTAVSGQPTRIEPVSPGVWALTTLESYKQIFDHLATALGKTPAADGITDDLATRSMMAGLQQMLTPMLLGMNAGSLVGHLATRSFGQYDVPIPRAAGSAVHVLIERIDAFADDWSLRRDDLRMWVCLHELTSHAVLNVPHVRAALTDLLTRYAASFRPDPDALTRGFESAAGFGDSESESADPMALMQQMMARPDLLLGASTTPEQQQLVPQLDAGIAFVVGYIDHAVDRAAARLIGAGSAASEAVRRRRLETSPADPFIEHLLGINQGRSQIERGQTFVRGVIERAGEEGLQRAFTTPHALPTPNELEAPGLWLARIDL